MLVLPSNTTPLEWKAIIACERCRFPQTTMSNLDEQNRTKSHLTLNDQSRFQAQVLDSRTLTMKHKVLMPRLDIIKIHLHDGIILWSSFKTSKIVHSNYLAWPEVRRPQQE